MGIARFSRGDIFVRIDPYDGKKKTHKQQGTRLIVILSNEKNNLYSKMVTGVPITSRNKKHLPVHVTIGKEFGLDKNSIVLCEQIQPIDKFNLIKKIGTCDESKMKEIEQAIAIQLGLERGNVGNIISDKIDIMYINETIEMIKEQARILDFLSKSGINIKTNLITKKNLLQRLKKYCESFGIDYKVFLTNHIEIIRGKEIQNRYKM